MIVIIPCWRRPALLAATLSTISRARGADKHVYLISMDQDYDPAIEEVIDTFKMPAVVCLRREDKLGHGPAWNILGAWREALAASLGDDWIGLIEEDTLVAEDIFEFWHDALDRVPSAWGVSACRNQNQLRAVDQDLVDAMIAGGLNTRDEIIYQECSYQSLAVALRRPFIEAVLKHAVDSYFIDPHGYCDRVLYDYRLPSWQCSQDGLFHRVIRDEYEKLIYPVVPRAFHAGWYGYNRREGIQLQSSNWREDSEAILEWAASGRPDHFNRLADPRYRDISPCQLIRPRAILRLI